MESLTARAHSLAVREVATPGGATVPVRAMDVRFGRATPDRLKPGTLPPPHGDKPLVSVGGDAMFGELALVRWLERDGWDAVWIDASRAVRFWRGMPHRELPVALPPAARATFDAIVATNDGHVRGFFDVLAWRAGQAMLLAYKAPGEALSRAERAWIGAAVRAGISPHDLWIVCGTTDE